MIGVIIGLGIVTLLALPYLAYELRRTKTWWIPGAALAAGAFGVLAMRVPHGDGCDSIANGLLVLAAIVLGIVSLLAFVLGMLPARRPTPKPELARATIVRH
jgi:hypothetical protein